MAGHFIKSINPSLITFRSDSKRTCSMPHISNRPRRNKYCKNRTGFMRITIWLRSDRRIISSELPTFCYRRFFPINFANYFSYKWNNRKNERKTRGQNSQIINPKLLIITVTNFASAIDYRDVYSKSNRHGLPHMRTRGEEGRFPLGNANTIIFTAKF